MTKSTPLINHFSALIEVENFNNDSELSHALDNFADILNLNVVKKFDHTFKPIGKTLVYVLSQSHLAVHTWPEYKLIHLDLVSCSSMNIEDVEKAIKESFSLFSITKSTLEKNVI